MRFCREPVSDLIKDGMELFRANALETSDDPNQPIKINTERYTKLEGAGRLVAFTARDKDDDLVGYSVVILNEHPHKVDSIQSFQDVMYMEPCHRGKYSMELMDYTSSQLKELGVDYYYFPVKMKNALGKLLERKGFKKTEEIYLRSFYE